MRVRLNRKGCVSHLLRCCFVITLLSSPHAAAGLEQGSQRSQSAPHFYVNTAFSHAPREAGRLEVYYEISYGQLKFLKAPDGFVARLEVQAIVYDSKGKQITGDSWRRRVRCSDYAETRAARGAYRETFSLALEPGKYVLVVKTENLDAGQASSVSLRMAIDALSSFPAIGFVKVGGCPQVPADSIPVRERVVPSARTRFGMEAPCIGVYGEICDANTGETASAYALRWRVVDEARNTRLDSTISVEHAGTVSPFLFSLSADDLTMGKYTLELSLGQGKPARLVQRIFEIDETRFSLETDLDETLTLLGYIAPSSELDRLKNTEGEERRAAWLDFWKRRDPYPETPENEFLVEFFDRVRYANENFSSLGPGWRTDRGRIYIRRGPPDHTETRPMGPSPRPYVIWYYFEQNVTFVFVDRMGLGDYELAGPSLE
ncbi:MAG: GWxTD domain-containing protein [Candidatus Eisenbacteria bacterium]